MKLVPAFAMFEICIVLALLTCITFLGTNSIAWLDHALLRAEFNALYHTFVALSRKAMLDGTIHTLFFKEHGIMYDDQEKLLPTSIIFGAPSQENPITFIEKRVLFFPDGKIQAGKCSLTDKAGRWYYALTCCVGQICYIRRYQYNHGSWALIT